MRELPKIISVDDHVVEPSHVWQTWLPEKWRERGPRVERKKWGPFVHKPGARYENREDPDGLWGDAWYLDGQLIYVQKRFVAIPLDATPGGDLSKFDPSVMVMSAVTYDEMRPGCYDRDERVKDMALNWTDGSLPFPTFPRLCGPVGGCEHPVVHHAALGCRTRRRGDPTQRGSGGAGVLFLGAPASFAAPDDPQWGVGSGVPGL